jgi:hypothetical protein
MTPPQHGKFRAVSDFIAWLAGVNPDISTPTPNCSAPSSRIVVGIDNWVKYVDQVDAVAAEYKQRFSIGRRYFTA